MRIVLIEPYTDYISMGRIRFIAVHVICKFDLMPEHLKTRICGLDWLDGPHNLLKVKMVSFFTRHKMIISPGTMIRDGEFSFLGQNCNFIRIVIGGQTMIFKILHLYFFLGI
ncbi:hypothetical protein U1Q18_035829 [Sarracenia purpurea var. burkii]